MTQPCFSLNWCVIKVWVTLSACSSLFCACEKIPIVDVIHFLWILLLLQFVLFRSEVLLPWNSIIETSAFVNFNGSLLSICYFLIGNSICYIWFGSLNGHYWSNNSKSTSLEGGLYHFWWFFKANHAFGSIINFNRLKSHLKYDIFGINVGRSTKKPTSMFVIVHKAPIIPFSDY